MSKSDKKNDTIAVSVCCDDKCSDKGGKKFRKKLKDLVEDQGLEDRVSVKKTDCLDECSDGPVAKVGKKKVTGLKAKKADEFLEKVMSGAFEKKGKKKDGKKSGKK